MKSRFVQTHETLRTESVCAA